MKVGRYSIWYSVLNTGVIMKVLVLGHDGRVTALCRALQKAPGVTRLWCWPGNETIRQEFRTLHHSDDHSNELIEIFGIAVEEEVEEETYIFAEIVQKNREELAEYAEREEEYTYLKGDKVKDEKGKTLKCEDGTPILYPWFEPPKEPEPDPEPFEPNRTLHYPLPKVDEDVLNMIVNAKPDYVIPSALEYYDNQMVGTLRARGITVLGADKITYSLEHHINEFRDLCIAHGIPTYPYVYARCPQDIPNIYSDQHGDILRVVPPTPHCLHNGAICYNTHQATTLTEKILQDINTDMHGGVRDNLGVIVEPVLKGDFFHLTFLFDGRHYTPITTTSSYEAGNEFPDAPPKCPVGLISPSPKVTFLAAEQIPEIMDKLTAMFERKRMYLRGLFTVTLFRTPKQVLVYSLHICPPDGILQNVLHFMDAVLDPLPKSAPTITRYMSDCVYYKLDTLPQFSSLTPSRLTSMTVAGYAECYPLKPIKYTMPDEKAFAVQGQLSIYNQAPTRPISPYMNTHVEAGFRHFEPNLNDYYSDSVRPLWITQTGEDLESIFNTIQDLIDVMPKLDGIKWHLKMERLNQKIKRRYLTRV